MSFLEGIVLVIMFFVLSKSKTTNKELYELGRLESVRSKT